jgi:hypothetical protein
MRHGDRNHEHHVVTDLVESCPALQKNTAPEVEWRKLGIGRNMPQLPNTPSCRSVEIEAIGHALFQDTNPIIRLEIRERSTKKFTVADSLNRYLNRISSERKSDVLWHI